MDIKCNDCLNSCVRYCFRCHTPHCYSCQRLHSQKFGGHLFKFPDFDYRRTTCETHYFKQPSSYCRECKATICMLCSPNDHNSHVVVDSFRDVKDELLEQITKEKSDVDECLKNIRYEIERRETIVKNFKKEMKSIIEQIPYGGRSSSIGKQIYNIRDSVIRSLNNIECNQPHELAVIYRQLKHLKATKYLYEEIQDIQRNVMAVFRAEDFVTCFLQYKSSIETYIRSPATCEEAPDLDVVYDHPSDEEINDLLFRIHIGYLFLFTIYKNRDVA